MKKYRIYRYGLLGHIFDVQIKKWYGWVLVKRFKVKIKHNLTDPFEIKYAEERAKELLEKLEEEL
jgi:hypothetical protein